MRQLIVVVMAMAIWTSASLAADAAARVRIGTFDTRAVALAYGRSQQRNAEVNVAMKQADEAKAAGNKAKVDEIKAKMEKGQFLAHMQVFSNAPIGDIMEKLRESLPGIAREAGVVAIVPNAEYVDPSVEVVDVTEAVAKQFKPDEKTLKIMKDLRSKPPLGLYEVAKMKD